ncbi:MAG: CRISPR system precrRNA processing endoribonuclease RAMP protein Cas6 [Armatimonadota bacterium]
MVAEVSIAFRALADTVFPPFHGRALQGWVYHLLAAGDAAHAAAVHRQAPVPFTCAELRGARIGDQGLLHIQAGQQLTLRLTTLDVATLRATEAGLAAAPPEVELRAKGPGAQRPRVLQAVTVDAGLVRALTYRDFLDMPGGRHWSLTLHSRTAFSRDGRHMLLPLPELIFANLVRKWNAFAPGEEESLRVDVEPLLEHVTYGVVVSDLADPHSEPLHAAHIEQGVVGTVGLAVLQDLPRPIFRQITTLLHFCRYAGLGERTAEGWGQAEAVRRPSGPD